MRRAALFALLLALPLATAGTAMDDPKGDVHASPERASVEYAAPEIDLLSLEVVPNEAHIDFILQVAAPMEQTLKDTAPMFAVTFQNADYDFGALRAGRFEEGWRFYVFTRNASGEGSAVLEGRIEGEAIHILVPHEILRSDLAWVVVSSAVQAERAVDAVDGGPAWLRDSMPDEGRGPAVPLGNADAGAIRSDVDGAKILGERRDVPMHSAAVASVLAGLLAMLRRVL